MCTNCLYHTPKCSCEYAVSPDITRPVKQVCTICARQLFLCMVNEMSQPLWTMACKDWNGKNESPPLLSAQVQQFESPPSPNKRKQTTCHKIFATSISGKPSQSIQHNVTIPSSMTMPYTSCTNQTTIHCAHGLEWCFVVPHTLHSLFLVCWATLSMFPQLFSYTHTHRSAIASQRGPRAAFVWYFGQHQ